MLEINSSSLFLVRNSDSSALVSKCCTKVTTKFRACSSCWALPGSSSSWNDASNQAEIKSKNVENRFFKKYLKMSLLTFCFLQSCNSCRLVEIFYLNAGKRKISWGKYEELSWLLISSSKKDVISALINATVYCILFERLQKRCKLLIYKI